MKPRTRNRALALVALAALVVVGALAQGPQDRTLDPDFSPHFDGTELTTVLLDVADNLSDRELNALLEELPADAELNSEYAAEEGLYRLTLPTALAADLVDTLSDDDRVEFAEPEYIYEIPDGDMFAFDGDPSGDGPDDPLYQFQWNFEQIGTQQAWNMTDGAGVVVAVIDTGVAYADDDGRGFRVVRDLGGTRMVDGYDFVDDDAFPFDEHGHGTHVAGTVAQTTNNGYGVAGVAPAVAIMPIRVLDAGGRGTTGDIADSIRWAADNGADIINMSLGGPLPSRIMADAVAYAHRQGVTVIAAAGNNGWSMPSFPAAYNNVIAVAATQYDRTTTFYSNYGRYVDIAAPGGNTRVDQNNDGQPDGIMQETLERGNPREHEFALYMGTSMASPHVAAVAALIHSQGVTHPDRIEQVLLESATQDVPEYNEDRYGAGLLDAAQATTHTLTEFQIPRVLLLAVIVFALVLISRSRSSLRADTPSGPAMFMTGTVSATGLSLLGGLLAWFGLATSGLAPWATSMLHWPSAVSCCSFTSNAIVMSALPALAVYALFGHVRSRGARGALLGIIAGLGVYFIGEAFAPLMDVRGIPGAGLADSLWLGINGVVVLGLAAVAANSRNAES